MAAFPPNQIRALLMARELCSSTATGEFDLIEALRERCRA
jgi:hypothetical protein